MDAEGCHRSSFVPPARAGSLRSRFVPWKSGGSPAALRLRPSLGPPSPPCVSPSISNVASSARRRPARHAPTQSNDTTLVRTAGGEKCARMECADEGVGAQAGSSRKGSMKAYFFTPWRRSVVHRCH